MQTEIGCPVFGDAAEVISTPLEGDLSSLLSPENLSERGGQDWEKNPSLRGKG